MTHALQFIFHLTLTKIIVGYFKMGMGVAESVKFHRNKLEVEAESLTEKEFANSRINPWSRQVTTWFEAWRNLNLGPRVGAGVAEVSFLCQNFSGLLINASYNLVKCCEVKIKIL